MRRGHLGQAVGGVGEPGEDLVALPLVVGAHLVEFARGVFAGPRGLCACVLGPRVGGRGALVGLRGLRERPGRERRSAARTRASASARACSIASCACASARLARCSAAAMRLRPCPPRRPCDRAVPVFLGDGDAGLGFLADPLELGGVRGGGLGQPVVSFACPGLLGGQVLAHLLGRLVRRGAHLVGGGGAALGLGPLGLGGGGALLGRGPG